jgi:hypothetical protein
VTTPPAAPAIVVSSAAFFAIAGALELGLALWEAPRPVEFWPVWEALGRAILHWLLAAGLWRRLALCRSIALVYCLAAVVTYAVVLALALGGAPFRYPDSVVVSSLFQVPSCALLFVHLRSPRATSFFPYRLFHG